MPGPTHENTYLVEHYRPGLGAAALEEVVTSVRDRVQSPAPTGSSPRVLCSVVVAADEAFLVVFSAESGHHLRDAYSRAGIGFDRICLALTHIERNLA